MIINFSLNSAKKTMEIQPGATLYELLKSCGMSSVKKSCGTSSCGVCTVLLDGKPVASCTYLAAKVEGRNVTTIEGLQSEADTLASLMNEEGAVQCGFCTPGLLLTVIAMKKELKDPNEQQIKGYLAANLCRCSGYEGQSRAINRYLEVRE